MATGFCVTQTPPTLLLLLSKLCLELEGSTVNFLVRNYFQISDENSKNVGNNIFYLVAKF